MRLKTPSPKLIRKGALIAFSISLITLIAMLWSTATPRSWQGLLKFNPVALPVIAGFVLLSWLFEGLRIQLISRVLGDRLSLRSILSINLATLFSGNITPFTSGGAPTQVYLLHKKGLPIGRATVVVTLRMALSTLCFTVGGPILVFVFQGALLRRLSLMAWAGPIRLLLFLALLISFGIIYVLIRPAKGVNFANWLFARKWILRILGEKADSVRVGFLKEIQEFHDSLMLIMQKKRLHLALVMVYTFLYWVAFFSIAPTIMLGFGFPVLQNWGWFILLQFVLSFLISFIPIPGGSGAAEMGFYTLFGFFVPKPMLAIFVALWRVLSFHLSTFVGGVFFMRHFKPEEPSEADLPG